MQASDSTALKCQAVPRLTVPSLSGLLQCRQRAKGWWSTQRSDNTSNVVLCQLTKSELPLRPFHGNKEALYRLHHWIVGLAWVVNPHKPRHSIAGLLTKSPFRLLIPGVRNSELFFPSAFHLPFPFQFKPRKKALTIRNS